MIESQPYCRDGSR